MYGTKRHFSTSAIASVLLAGAVLLATSGPLKAQTSSGDRHHDRQDGNHRVSPARRIKRSNRKPRTRHDVDRPLDGFGNNLSDRDTNAANTQLRRFLPNDYEDKLDKMAGQVRRTPREISNLIFAQSGDRINTAGASDFV